MAEIWGCVDYALPDLSGQNESGSPGSSESCGESAISGTFEFWPSHSLVLAADLDLHDRSSLERVLGVASSGREDTRILS